MVQAGAVYEKCLNVDGRVSTGWRMWKVETAVADDAEGKIKMEMDRGDPIDNNLPF
jgi:hypothetical protein